MHNKVWTTDLIGVVAEDTYIENTFREAVFVNSQDLLQFQIKLISQPPDSFPNVKYITGFASDLVKWGFEDDPYTTDDERKQNLRDWLNDSLLVFIAERKILYNHNEVYQAKNIRLIPKAESFHDKVALFPLPIFSCEAHGMAYEEFLEKVTKRKFIGRIEGISTEANDTPTIILWKNEENEYIAFGEFDKHQYAHGGFSFSIRGGLKSTPFEKEWLDDSYIDPIHIPNVMYVTIDTYQYLAGAIEASAEIDLTSALQEAAVGLAAPEKEDVKAALTAEPVSKAVSEEKRSVSKPAGIGAERTPSSVQQAAPQAGSFPAGSQAASAQAGSPQPQTKEETSESRFLDYFVATTQEMGLLYSEKDLVNFHTAMKSSNLVILAGMSGTGKSKLVQAYSRALGLYSDQFTFISVRPSWTDDADLIGYADTLHMVYRPGDSGLINVLKQAEKEKDKLFIICFDEMNLARVEHYFSQFLSILEMDFGRRELRLYNDELATRLYNSAQYPPTISIKDNVMFVGTVNLDESTYHFSDKVLDRANVIQLEVLPYEQLKELGDKKKVFHSRDQVLNYEDYDSFKNNNTALNLTSRELEFLWKLHNGLQQVNRQSGIGQRIVRQIDGYLKNLPAQEALSREDAFDLQIVQRILTKIRGSEDQLYSFLGTYDKNSGTVAKSYLWDLLDEYKDISDFEQTRQSVVDKAKELKLNGYTL
ncbi:AAA family ATPase [Bacillus sp. FJAT-27225]|uniref:McrB family protein n=1 Tax=Bacillus sp. FJAT-27225 TaxID=1743144 RepID=UPI00080C2E46|nr:AAA family ATPase [Bacillus sp. FJAT-27225]OCA87658.1 AAA family ATPase [Bacillus sp. FJAT-27225]